MALDSGVAFVRNRWDFGVGVGGVANRIVWSEIERHQVGLVSFSTATSGFMSGCPHHDLERRFELPVTYTSDVAYHREKWSILTEVLSRLPGPQFPQRPGVQAW